MWAKQGALRKEGIQLFIAGRGAKIQLCPTLN